MRGRIKGAARYELDDVIQLAICARELNPSLFMMLRTWVATVASEMNRRPPICLLLRPSAIDCATSIFRDAPVRLALGEPSNRSFRAGMTLCERRKIRPHIFLLYRSRLVPRVLPLLGLVGVPLLLAGDIGTLFNFWGSISSVSALLPIPVALFEFSLGVYLTVKGFKPSPITSAMEMETGKPDRPIPGAASTGVA
jgi:hypothetical protein